MSSMRNAVQRRTHKERAQPHEREKWGILEKHKDYSLRARDYNEKKKRLKVLQSKAAERNPDEFHFAMMSSRTRDGGQKVADRGNKSLSIDSVKLLKTQDAGYLRIMMQKARRNREALEKEVSLGLGKDRHRVTLLNQEASSGEMQHIAFVENQEDQKNYGSGQVYDKVAIVLPSRIINFGQSDSMEDYEEENEDDPEVFMKRLPASRRSLEAKVLLSKANQAYKKRHKRREETRNAKLTALRNREMQLIAAEQELELQRAKMSSSVGGVTRAGLKWKVRERKK